MIGSFFARALILALGQAYPAYECYKTIELNKPDIAQMRFWCQYWILVAFMNVIERIADPLISWLPMYGEAKLIFFLYLWYPKTKGTQYVYDTFFKPYIAKHEKEIDRYLSELRTRASDMVIMHGHKLLAYAQNIIFEGLRYISSPKNSPVQTQTETAREEPNEEKNDVPDKKLEKLKVAPKLIKTYSKQKKQGVVVSSPVLKTSPVEKKRAAVPLSPVASDSSENDASSSDEAKMKDVDSSETIEKDEKEVEESVMEETIRVTRARLRKRMGSIGTSTGTGAGSSGDTGTETAADK